MKTRLDLEKAIVETQHKYNDIIFGNDSRICEACLNKLPKQLVINQKARNQKLMDYKRWSLSPEKHSKDGDTMVDKRTGDALGTKVGYNCYK